MITLAERRELLAKLEESRTALLSLISRYDEREMEQRHKEGDRTFKAMLFHVAEAEQMYIESWARRARDEDEPDVSRAPGAAALPCSKRPHR